MANYCVNRDEQPTGEHEVHDLASNWGCLPDSGNRIPLGYYFSCAEAVTAARQRYDNVDGCRWCVPACHSR